MVEFECPSCFYSFEKYHDSEYPKNQVLCPRCGTEGAIKKDPAPRRIDEEWLKYLESRSCHLSFG